jgi:ATP-binding cassette, subfamily B, vacuolar membrane transporter HMT1/ACLQ
MWQKQIRAERAAEEARAASKKAQKLMRQANIGSKKQPETPSDGYRSLASSTILTADNGNGVSKGSDTSEDISSSSSDGDSTHTVHGDSDRN